MFGIFKNKKPELTHFIFRTKLGKYKSFVASMQVIGDSKQIWLLYHFDQTGEELKKLLDASGLRFREKASAEKGIELIKVDDLRDQIAGQLHSIHFEQVIVAELHPAGAKDLELNAYLRGKDPNACIDYYTSLDSHFFTVFGGERMLRVMDQLGVKEDERIEHAMITSSIKKAQQKLAGMVVNELPAFSEEEWVKRNVLST